MPKLVVLIGAGASFDCVDAGAGVNETWRPPVVASLFGFEASKQSSYGSILRRYPRVNAAADEIRSTLRRKNMPLERYLAQMKGSKSPNVRQQYRQVPLYLQELLWRCSVDFPIVGGTKFNTLVARIEHRLHEDLEEVLYLSLNYDVLMEAALKSLYLNGFSNIVDYVPDGNWSLVKLHGSVNWGFPLFRTSDRSLSPHLLELGAMPDQPGQTSDNLMVLNSNEPYGDDAYRVQDGHFFYPAIALPIEGKSGFVCPPWQVERATSVIKDCKNFLVLGCRIADDDVINLLNQTSEVARLRVVNGDAKAGEEAVLNLEKPGLAFTRAPAPSGHGYLSGGFSYDVRTAFGGGFTSFVDDGALDEFLSDLK